MTHPTSERPAYLDLAPGDPWTFIHYAPIMVGDNNPREAIAGDHISKWFATNEPGRVGTTYETVFVGFAVQPPADGVAE